MEKPEEAPCELSEGKPAIGDEGELAPDSPISVFSALFLDEERDVASLEKPIPPAIAEPKAAPTALAGLAPEKTR